MAELRSTRPRAVALDSETVIFKGIASNNGRIIARIDWTRKVVYIKWMGTHAEYDHIDARKFTRK